MRKLILDQYTHQALFKQFFGNTLTGLGWAFWIYLWLPLFAAIKLLLGQQPEQVTSAASHSLLALLATLANHASTVVIMILVFVGWALLQWAGKRYRREALQKRQTHVPTSSLALPAIRVVNDMQRWQQAQTVIVSHDDASGFIKRVEILKPENWVAPLKYRSAYLYAVSATSIPLIDKVTKRSSRVLVGKALYATPGITSVSIK
jgi:poly-beta-1,6-N-acetyl-D-glucosamine biosynthesis protein PgaD